ncbi:ribonuclease R [Cetobacterium sp. 8H]|uniref:ribonuclease R n=1 Tax=Cetobacterium sp. 8H TaxID=2759681 RepID=UPI00163D0A83|nr:ribonuclease R [Cetobacterium sp. 8H]MBC2851265.1 ribonuclease R [Cetobacterium sp. 8H]
MKIDKQLDKLKNILKGSKALTLDEITKAMGWSPKFKKENRTLLEEWLETGELMKNKRNKYNLPENLGFIKGKFSNIKGKFAFVDTDTEGYFIPRSKFGTALDGDTVLITVDNPEGKGKKEGEVVKVLVREKNTVIGVFEKKENFGFVRPTQSFGRDIYIPKNFFNRAKDGELVVVEMISWGSDEKKPEGKIKESIGAPFDTDNMIKALILREGMSEDFPDEVLAEARRIPVTISPEEIKKRKDLRSLPIITIDGDDAKDLDDAVYVEKLDNGFYKLIVAIADVSHYIPTGSLLDKEAEKRGNSVYMVDRVLPMFPKEISNGICSLNPNEDKLTFSVELLIDEHGRVMDIQTYKSVIKTVHRMTYNNVNKIIAQDQETTEKYKDIVDMIFTMLELSKIIRAIKYNRGSIDFDLPEVKVVLDENKKVKYLKNIERGESERIIEDFMIMANEAVAEKLFWLEIPSVYRVHENPDPERVKTLNDTLAKFGYKIHSFEDIHPKKFQSIIEDSEAKGINMIVHKMILMSLKQARYGVENLGHFGLSSSYYTHFTSPIRRYADLLIHRILDIANHGYPTKKQYGTLINYLPEVTAHISQTERKAMKIEDESIKIKVVEYMLDKIGDEFKATIVGFNNKKIFFETEEHVECFWDVTTAQNFYEFDDNEYVMKDMDTGREFHLGDKMDILIARADLQMLEVEAVPTEFHHEYTGGRKERRY